MQIVASILNADHAHLGDAVLAAKRGGASAVHFDITDGAYVQTLTFGPQVVKDIKRTCSLSAEVHLELDNPLRMIDMFGQAGADVITVQADCCQLPFSIFKAIRKYGAHVGLSIHVCECIEQYRGLIRYVDQLLLMSVEPGFGGQPFSECIYKKVRVVQNILRNENLNIPIGVDGGIGVEIARKLCDMGVDFAVIGSAIFGDVNIEERVRCIVEKVK